MSHRRGARCFGDGFRMRLGEPPGWWRAGDECRAGYGRAQAGQGHALGGGTAEDVAEPGALAADSAQGAVVPKGVRVFGGVEFGGGIPVLARAPQGVARGPGHGERGEEGQQQELQGGRNPGVRDRPRQEARGVGFGRSGGLKWH